jgi:hypothetical protein
MPCEPCSFPWVVVSTDLAGRDRDSYSRRVPSRQVPSQEHQLMGPMRDQLANKVGTYAHETVEKIQQGAEKLTAESARVGVDDGKRIWLDR